MKKKAYSKSELNNMSKEDLIALVMANQEAISLFEERIAMMQSQQFGRKTERIECLDQMSIFNEAEELHRDEVEEPDVEEIVIRRKRPAGKREEQLEGVPSRIEHYEIPEEELIQIFGENGWKRLPDEISRVVEIIPSQHEVVERRIAVYAGKKTDKIVKAKHPKKLFPGSLCSPSMLAAVMNGKYTNGMPLYRIAQELERNDIKIEKRNLANWVIWGAERYLSLMTDRLHQELLKSPVVHADETPCWVSKDNRPANSKSFMFVYRTGELNKEKPIILYDYQKTRNGDHVQDFLERYRGYLMTDAFSGYHKVDRLEEHITVAHCWAHARRDFADAIKMMPKSGGSKQARKNTVAHTALVKIKAIYKLEESLADLSPEDRLKARKKDIAPDVDAFFTWVKEQKLESIASQKIREGLQYCINQEKYLRVFLEDGNVPIDNSAAERAIRPFTVGRNNWKLIDTIHGAQSSAIIYSLVETAKANNLKVYEYLKYLLSEIPQHMDDTDLSFLDDLLPWSEKLPEECRKKVNNRK